MTVLRVWWCALRGHCFPLGTASCRRCGAKRTVPDYEWIERST
jgi:hypothetical protein